MTSTRERTRTGLILVTTTAVVVLVGAAAAGTPVGVITTVPEWTPVSGLLPQPTLPAEPEAIGTPLPLPATPGGPVAGAIVQGLLALVGVALVAAAAVAVAVLVLRTVRRVRDRGGDRVEPGDPARAATRAAVRAAVTAAQDGIDVDADANRVIIACWVHLERAAAAAGVPRRASQTAAEHVVGMLDSLHLPAAPARRLAELYAAALFSGVPLSDRDVADARGALRLLDDALDPPTDPR